MIASKPLNYNTKEKDFLDYALEHDFGSLHFKVDPESGMKALIAIHSTKLGPALGGCRFITYPNTQAAIEDAMRLAMGMSYKAASVHLPLGGGKSVIMMPQEPYDRKAYMHAFGRFVDELKGQYITALDSGTLLSDMDLIAEHTPYVASLSKFNGDPSPSTAKGVLRGIEAAVSFKLKKESLKDLHIAIQGLGHVGKALAEQLHQLGARLTVSDINPERSKELSDSLGATVVDTQRIHQVPCDVFAPCALGAVLNDESIAQLQTLVVAGAANNQLAHRQHGKMLHERGILYAPDYIINAGGLIFAASKYLHRNEDQIDLHIEKIYSSLMTVFERAAHTNKPTNEVSDLIAREKLDL